MSKITKTKLARMRRITIKIPKGIIAKKVIYTQAEPRHREFFSRDSRLSWLVSIGQIINWDRWLKRKNRQANKQLKQNHG